MESRHSSVRDFVAILLMVATMIVIALILVGCGANASKPKPKPKQAETVPVTTKQDENFAEEVSTVRLDQMETKSDMVATLYNALVPFYPSIAPSAVEVAFNTKGDGRAMYIENGVAYPPALADAGNKALDGNSNTKDDEDVYLENTTGVRLADICDYVDDSGMPAIIWVTPTYEQPTNARYEESDYGITEYDQPHTVIVTGCDGQDVHLSDALSGDMTVGKGMLTRVYDACGRQSVTFKS